MRRRRKVAWIAAALAAIIVALLTVDTVLGVTALGAFPVTVAATLVDDATGRPVEGASVLTLREASDAGDRAWVADAQRRARERADLPWPFRPWPATSRSAADGSVRLTTDVRWCRHVGPLSGPFRRDLPPYRGVAALLVEREGFARTVVDCTKGRWTVHPRNRPDDPHATLDVGEIRLRRAP